MRLGGKGLPIFRLGLPLSVLGALLGIFGFILPWITFESVVPASAPQLSGYELPRFLRSASFLLRLAFEQAFGTDTSIIYVVWLPPAAAALAILLAVSAILLESVGRGVGVLHVLLGTVVLGVMVYAFWSVTRVSPAGVGVVLDFVGIGLWLTLVGMLFLVVGGIMQAMGR